jgi:hypothetical protein
VTRLSRHRVPTVNPANHPILALMIRVQTIRIHPSHTVCRVDQAATQHRANRIPANPNQANPNRTQVNRQAKVDQRLIQVIRRQATLADRVEVKATQAEVIPVQAIRKAPTANHRVILKVNRNRIAVLQVLAPPNHPVKVGVNRKTTLNPTANRRANRIPVVIPTVQADRAIPVARRRAPANLKAQVLLIVHLKVLANPIAMKTRRVKAKTQVAIAPRTVQAITQAIATPQVIIHQAVHPTALPIAHPTAIQIHNRRTRLHPIHTTHLNPTPANQAHPTPIHRANRQEVPAVDAPVHGFGHAVGSCSSRTAKVLNHPRAQVAMTAK